MKLVFWLEELNLHFSAVIRAMTNMGHEISVFAKQELKAHRRALGWIIPDFGDVQVLSIQDQKDIQSIVRSKKEFIHILVGMRWPFVTSIIKGCIKYGCHFGFYCEAPHPDGKREFAKRVFIVIVLLLLAERQLCTYFGTDGCEMVQVLLVSIQ